MLGRCRIKLATGDTDKVDKARIKTTAPNLIHSLDASLLCLSALRFDAPISLFYDSVLCRATDMGVLSAIVRETYMHLFAEHDYLTTFAQHIGAETKPPIIGDLEPSTVIDSTYFLLMARTIFKADLVLEGFPSPYLNRTSLVSVSLQLSVMTLLISSETDRPSSLAWAESKLKNPKRSTLKPEPWEEVAKGKYKIKFSWKMSMTKPVIDTEGTPVTDENVPVYSGSKVKLAFYQKPYVLKDGVTYGTSLKLVGVQIVSVSSEAGTDVGDMDDTDVADLFGKTKGFKQSEPNVIADQQGEAMEDDF